ncbi:MAG: permease prefix domain 1-containing protein [Candidatus Latescibacterota bacterium]|jgi:hypothetical protein
MTAGESGGGLEARIGQWRAYLRRRQAIHEVDVEELEDHLRGQVATLVAAGLAEDEAFLVAVRRLGSLDELSREFGREHSERLWKQLVSAPSATRGSGNPARTEVLVVFCLAGIAALAVKTPELFGLRILGPEGDAGFYARNFSLFVLPLLAGYFAWKRRSSMAGWYRLVLPFIAAGAFANAYPFLPGGATEWLTTLHLPIALWLVVGMAYAGDRWHDAAGRMDFVRFSGELFIYYVLIACGGGVLTAFTMGMFAAIGLKVEWLAGGWLLPCGALGAVIVGAWLVEAKQSVIENMAPVLTRIFTPLFVLVLLAVLGTMIWTGRGIAVERNLLIGLDLLLVLILGLLLYAASARDPQAPPDAFDVLQLLLVLCALVIDVLALAAITARISEFGFSANKVAALGENLLLLVNLAWSAWLYGRFLLGRGPFAALERWQTAYLPAYSWWAGLVVVLFPPLFG